MAVYYLRPRNRRMVRRMRPTQFNGGRRMPIDFHADSEAYILTAAVPGLSADDLQIEILDDVLTLKVQPSEEEAQEDGVKYMMREIESGEMVRRLCLPEAVDANKAEASVENGLLTLRIPKAEEAKPKKITVKD